MVRNYLVGLVLAGLCAAGCAQETTGALVFSKFPQLNNQRATSATLVDGTSVTAARVILGLEQVLVPSGVLAGTGVTVDRTTATVTINASSSGTVTTTQTVVVAGSGISVANDANTTYTVTNTAPATSETDTLQTVTNRGNDTTQTVISLATGDGFQTSGSVRADAFVYSQSGFLTFGGTVAPASRGANATDLQTERNDLSQVASGQLATIGGGGLNTASGARSVVSGGEGNVADEEASTVAGGQSNAALSAGAVVSGGTNNQATGVSSVVAGGQAVLASGEQSVVSGGNNNLATATYSTVSGGTNNQATGQFSTVVGGSTNVASGNTSIAGGGGSEAQSTGSIALGLFIVETLESTFRTYGLRTNAADTTISGRLWELGQPVPNVTEIVAGTNVTVGVSGSTVTISAAGTPEADTLQAVTDRGNTTTQTVISLATSDGFRTSGSVRIDGQYFEQNLQVPNVLEISGGAGMSTQYLPSGGPTSSFSSVVLDNTANLQFVTDNGATTTRTITAGNYVRADGITTQIMLGEYDVFAGTGIGITAFGTGQITIRNTGVVSEADTLQTVTNRGDTTTRTINANRLATSTTLRLQQLSADPSGVVDGDGWFRNDTQRYQDQRGGSVLSRPGTLYSLDATEDVTVFSGGNTDFFPGIASIPAALTTVGPRTFRISIGGYWTNGGIPGSPNVIGLRFIDTDLGVGTDVGGNNTPGTASQFVFVTGTYLLRINPNNGEAIVSAALATQEGALASPWTVIDTTMNAYGGTGGYTIQPYFINNDTLDNIQAFLTHFTIEVID